MPYPVRQGAGGDDASMSLSRALNSWMEEFGPNGLFKTCGNCKYMVKQGPAFCNLYQMTPPVEVVIASCPSHDDEHEIPF